MTFDPQESFIWSETPDGYLLLDPVTENVIHVGRVPFGLVEFEVRQCCESVLVALRGAFDKGRTVNMDLKEWEGWE